MTPKKKKRPVVGRPLPGKKKIPRAARCPECGFPDSSRPVWRMAGLDMDGPWSWAGIDRSLFDQIHERLRNWETMTWFDIERGGSHFVDTDKLDKRARDRLEELRQDDVDQLFSLRVDARLRLWGIREGAALRIMWLDPDHEVCPSMKKHT